MDPTRPAAQVWSVYRKPVDIQGRLMFRVDFKLVGWEIELHHAMCDTLEEADAECNRLLCDLTSMHDGPFREKYGIGHDLRRGY